MPNLTKTPEYWKLVERLENDAAVISNAKHQVKQFRLLFRAMRRRALMDEEDFNSAMDALSIIDDALVLEQRYAFAAREAPGGNHEG